MSGTKTSKLGNVAIVADGTVHPFRNLPPDYKTEEERKTVYALGIEINPKDSTLSHFLSDLRRDLGAHGAEDDKGKLKLVNNEVSSLFDYVDGHEIDNPLAKARVSLFRDNNLVPAIGAFMDAQVATCLEYGIVGHAALAELGIDNKLALGKLDGYYHVWDIADTRSGKYIVDPTNTVVAESGTYTSKRYEPHELIVLCKPLKRGQ